MENLKSPVHALGGQSLPRKLLQSVLNTFKKSFGRIFFFFTAQTTLQVKKTCFFPLIYGFPVRETGEFRGKVSKGLREKISDLRSKIQNLFTRSDFDPLKLLQ